MTETIHRIRALESGETLNFDEGYTCGPDRCWTEFWEMLNCKLGHFVNEGAVLDSDMACFGSPKTEFEEIGEFLLGGGFRARS